MMITGGLSLNKRGDNAKVKDLLTSTEIEEFLG